MRPIALFSCACSALLLLACERAAPPLAFDSIALERTQCYGQCPAYQVEVHADGRVRYTGLAFVATEGVRESRIAAADVRQLSEALRQVRAAGLRDRHLPQNQRCPVMPTDGPSTRVRVRAGGQRGPVEPDTDCPRPDLFWLAERIDALARTGPLVHGR